MDDMKIRQAAEYALRVCPVVEDVPSEDGDYQSEIYDVDSLIPFLMAFLRETGLHNG